MVQTAPAPVARTCGEPSISLTACSRFESVYGTDMGKAWPPPPPTNGDEEWLWVLDVNASRYGVFERHVRFVDLPEVADRGEVK
jgi:hypothetical protein